MMNEQGVKMNKLSDLAAEVVARYDAQNNIQQEFEEDDLPESRVRGNYNTMFCSSVRDICQEECISEIAVKKIICLAKERMARRLYILTEIERLENLFGGSVSFEEIDELVSENLFNLIKNGNFSILFRESVL